MAENNIGGITQVIGAVIDIKFTDGNLPEITLVSILRLMTAVNFVVVEVAQHLGDDVVRCIAMGLQMVLSEVWMQRRQVPQFLYR